MGIWRTFQLTDAFHAKVAYYGWQPNVPEVEITAGVVCCKALLSSVGLESSYRFSVLKHKICASKAESFL